MGSRSTDVGAKVKIVLEFIFEERQEFDFEDPELELVKIKLGKGTTVSEDDRDSIAERWGQSDTWHVDIHNDILDVIDSGDTVRYD